MENFSMSNFKKIWTSCLCWLMITTALPAQVTTLESEYFSVNDGLSERQINDILLSRYGLIWLATDRGLNMFDGYSFQTFTSNENDSTALSISANQIERLVESEEGSIFILYKNNISFFDLFNPRSLKNKKVELHPKRGIKGVPKAITFNANGKIFILTSNEIFDHIYTYETGTDSFKLVTRLKGLKSPEEQGATIQMLPMVNGFFFINNSSGGLKLYDSGGNVVKIFKRGDFHGSDINFLYPRHPYLIHQDKQSRVWLSFSNNPGVFIFDPTELDFKLMSQLPDGKFFTKIWEDQLGNVLLAQTASAGSLPTVERLFCISTSGHLVDFSHLTGASNNIISCAAKDFFKTVFFGIDTGFKIVRNSRTKIKTFLAKNLDQDRRGAIMRGITSDGRNYVYFANELNHWYALDLDTEKLDTLHLTDEITGKAIPFSFANNLIYDKKGFLWGAGISNEKGILLKYDIENCTTKKYEYPDDIKSLMMDSTGILWIGCQDKKGSGSLIRFLPEQEHFIGFWDLEGKNPFEDNFPRFITRARNGTLWIGTNKGLFNVNETDLTVKGYNSIGGEKKLNLNNDVVLVIHEDTLGKIWIGTQKGLNILDPVNETITYYTQKDGLASDIVCGILPDKLGNYWISTFNGLSYFDTREKSFRSFFGADGFSNDEFNIFSYFKDHKGRYYLGGVNGMNAFYPNDLLIEKDIPKPVLTKITRYNSWDDSLYTMVADIFDLKELVIGPYDNNFSFDFALPIYDNSRKNQFKYFMENYDKEWIFASTNHTSRYNKLPAGKYIFHVKGADPNGNWSKESTRINIVVRQIFYKKFLFIALVFLLFVLATYRVFQYQVEQKLRVERLRAKLSSDLHDELSGLLTGIAMQTDMLSLGIKETNLKDRLKKIGTDSRTALSRMNDVIWSVDSRKDKVEELIIRMREHADEILLPIEISYKISTHKLDLNQKMKGRIRQDLYFIYKEIINNVAKHSNASHVKIDLRNNGQIFKMVISDNGQGPGNGKAAPKSGQGMKNLKMRAQHLNAQLTFLEDNGFTVILSMQKFLKS